jgi:hypothetical protein
MKKLFLSLTILLAIGFFANQAKAQSTVGFGFRGGLNIANINDIDGDVGSRTGLMIGGYFNFLVPNSPVSIQPEILYAQKGFESGGVTGQLDYVEVPVLAKFDFITDGNITPHVYFGPYIGFNVNANLDGDEDLIEDNETDIDTATKSTDFGVVVGGGLDFGQFNAGVRYGAGLTEIFEGDFIDNISGAKNGVFSIVAGISF